MVAAGVALSFLTAGVLAHAAADRDRRAFETSASEVASTFQLAVQRIEDLTAAAAGTAVTGTGGSNAQWSAWAQRLRVFRRYPELANFGFIELVTPGELPAYAHDATADRGETFQLLPAGERSFYCFLRLTIGRADVEPVPLGADLCTVGTLDRLLLTRDAATTSYEAVTMAGSTWIGVQTAAYRGGVVPATVDARREAFLGWVGLLVDPGTVLSRSLAGHPGVTVQAHYASSLSQATFSFGRRPAHAATTARQFGSGWVVTVFRRPIPSGIFDRGASFAIFAAGVVLSLLMGVIVLFLQTWRSRAERLVHERTEQLRFQALHDPLTGLANRALIMDRLEHLLQRAHRHDTRCAVLYLDLDGFKLVNDTFGHPTGDELLHAVAGRLDDTIRGADTIGRLGGDEFVVLLDGDTADIAPQLVAERILTAIREPIVLGAAEQPVRVSTSIGIAVSTHASTATELLRQADIALYRSKGAGRDRWFQFAPETILLDEAATTH